MITLSASTALTSIGTDAPNVYVAGQVEGLAIVRTGGVVSVTDGSETLTVSIPALTPHP